jgi:hypothetical protein
VSLQEVLTRDLYWTKSLAITIGNFHVISPVSLGMCARCGSLANTRRAMEQLFPQSGELLALFILSQHLSSVHIFPQSKSLEVLDSNYLRHPS